MESPSVQTHKHFVSFSRSKEVNGEKTSVKDVPALSGRYTITPKEHRFMIDKTLETDAGKYACSQGDDSFEVEVIGESIALEMGRTGLKQSFA